MLREYEFTMLVKAEGSDSDRGKVFENYESILKREGGSLLKKDDWGVRKLSYPIKSSFKGHYALYNVATVPSNIAECERLMRIDDNVLRYLVVKIKDSVGDIAERMAELAKEQVVPENDH